MMCFVLSHAGGRSMLDENEVVSLLSQGELFAAEQDLWVKQGFFRFMNTEQMEHVSLGVFSKFMCGAWLASKTILFHLAFHVYDYNAQGFLDNHCIRHIIRLGNEVAESHRRYNINIRSKVIAVFVTPLPAPNFLYRIFVTFTQVLARQCPRQLLRRIPRGQFKDQRIALAGCRRKVFGASNAHHRAAEAATAGSRRGERALLGPAQQKRALPCPLLAR
jgi:hypothetical protein